MFTLSYVNTSASLGEREMYVNIENAFYSLNRRKENI